MNTCSGHPTRALVAWDESAQAWTFDAREPCARPRPGGLIGSVLAADDPDVEYWHEGGPVCHGYPMKDADIFAPVIDFDARVKCKPTMADRFMGRE